MDVDLSHLPQHIAIIMDGNGRWSQQRGLPRLDGHKTGVSNARKVIEIFDDYHLKYLTLYAFSTENWSRPDAEIDGIFRILNKVADRDIQFFHNKGIKIRHLGRLDGLALRMEQKIRRAVEITKNNPGMVVSIALNYGGRDEIVKAIREICAEGIPLQNIDENLIGKYLYTTEIPDPDLVIRTGGEMRLSNFLLWQAAYAELYFTSTLWPDFGRGEIEKALITYSCRQRRFGSLESEG